MVRNGGNKLKKNGKTLLTSLISCYELFNLEEPSPFVIAVAASKDNATQIYNELSNTIRNSALQPYLAKGDIKVRKHIRSIEIPSLNATFVCMPSDGSRLHGWSASLVAIDEMHAHRNASVYKALRYATASRPKHGRVVVISTAGNSTSHFYYSIYEKSKKVLAGEDLDIRHYAEVYEADPTKPTEKSQWHLANPSIGTSFYESTFEDELKSSQHSTADWLNFQQLRLNIWVKPSESCWLEVRDWDEFTRKMDESTLLQADCHIGIDLSQTIDPSSVSTLFKLKDGSFFVKSWAWVAEEGAKLREAANLPAYQSFPELEFTEGNMIDLALIKSKVLKLCSTYNVISVNFDPNSAYVLMNDIASEGYECLRIPQTPRYYNSLMRRFEALYKAGKILNDGGSWLRYCFENIRVEINKNQEIRPVKGKSVDHIDGAIATLLAAFTAFQGETTSLIEIGVTFV